MKYRITHTTEYSYNESVPVCHNLTRLHPRNTPTQKCSDCEIVFWPGPALRRDRADFFGNLVSWTCIQQPHDRLRISAASHVDVSGFPKPAETELTWEATAQRLAGALSSAGDHQTFSARQYSFDSTHAMACPKVAEFALPSFPARRPVVAAVLDLIKRIHDEFTFDAWATNVGTPVLEVLSRKRGVCQDFAHLTIAALRSLGLAARYVSGYVVTHPAPGQERLRGADASHAWVSVFIPDVGWLDFDPTHGSMPTDQHITLGWARDYDDIAPVKGIVFGGHRHGLSVAVDVEAVGDELRRADS